MAPFLLILRSISTIYPHFLAKFSDLILNYKFYSYLCTAKYPRRVIAVRPVRLSARTQDFHS